MLSQQDAINLHAHNITQNCIFGADLVMIQITKSDSLTENYQQNLFNL